MEADVDNIWNIFLKLLERQHVIHVQVNVANLNIPTVILDLCDVLELLFKLALSYS